MLAGMDLFQKKISDRSFCILEVARVKNGFFDYKHEAASYTDIKFNVIIKGKKHCVIGEVQFLFRKMFDYKKIAHSLYSIERRKEFVDDLAEILPIKLDLEKQLFIHAARNNINGLTDLMVTHGFTAQRMLQLNQQKQSILTPICAINCEKALRFLNSIPEINSNQLKERLLTAESSGTYPLERAIQNDHFNGVVRYIFEKDKFSLINHRDNRQKTPLSLCWNKKRGKCALVILQNVNSFEDRLKMIEDTGTPTTSLQYALEAGDLSLVEFIFDQVSSNPKLKNQLLNARTAAGRNNFHFACQGGNVEVLKLLLLKCNDEKQKAQLFMQNNNSQAPAFEATSKGKPECVRFILGKMNSHQKTKFFNATGAEPINKLLGLGSGNTTGDHVKTLRVLVEHVNKDDLGLTTVFLFASRNNDVELGKLVLSKTTNEKIKNKILNYQGPLGNWGLHCALHECAKRENVEFLQWLISVITDDSKQFLTKDSGGRSPLMIAAENQNIKGIKLMLNKVKSNTKFKNEVLAIKSNSGYDAMQYALNSRGKNKVKTTKVLIGYFDENDLESIFLPSIQLGDVNLLQNIWKKTNGDKALQKKLLSIQDKNKYNAFLLVAKNGSFSSLEWLLSLNDDEKDGDKEDEENLTQRHPTSKETPLLLCIGNDNRKKYRTNLQIPELTEEQKENYYKCVELIFSKVTNKRELVFETTHARQDALMYAVKMGNIATTNFLLSQINDRDKKQLIGKKDSSRYTHITHAINGGDIEIVKIIYKLFQKYGKLSLIENDTNALSNALTQGALEITEWVLFTLMKDTSAAIKALNNRIRRAKTTRKFVLAMKSWLNKLFAKVEIITDVNDIVEIFKWILKESTAADISILSIILQKIPYDEQIKETLFKRTNCLQTVCRENQVEILRKLLEYLDSYIQPIFQSYALIEAINKGNENCVKVILKSIKTSKDKNRLIEAAKSGNQNALMAAIKVKSSKIIDLVFNNHTNIANVLGDAFIYCIEQAEVANAQLILAKAKDRQSILNVKGPKNKTILMYALSGKKNDGLKFIIQELKQDGNDEQQIEEKEEIKSEETDDMEDEKMDPEDAVAYIHPMYLLKDVDGSNIFHVLFKNKECSTETIKLLEAVLPKETILKLLLERNNDEELPLNYAFENNGKDILSWILDQLQNPLEKFEMIAGRNKFEKSVLNQTVPEKSIAKETKPFLAKVITDCLEQLDLNNLELQIIKDTYQYTIDWEYPELQKLILSTISDDQHEILFNRDNMYSQRTFLHSLVECENEEMYKTILSKLTNTKQLKYHDNQGKDILSTSINKGSSTNGMKLIFDKFKDQLELYEFIAGDGWNGSAFPSCVSKKNKQYMVFLLGFLKDSQKNIALHAVAHMDRDLTWIPSIMGTLSKDIDQKTRYDLIRSKTLEGFNVYSRALKADRRKPAQWILDDEIKDLDDPILFQRNNNDEFGAFHVCRYADYFDVIESVLSKLSPKKKLEHLCHKSFTGSSLLKRTYNASIAEVEKKAIMAAFNDIQQFEEKDIDMILDIFIWLVTVAAQTSNNELIQLILKKVPQSMQKKLYCCYEGDKNWNIMTRILTERHKELFQYLIKTIDGKEIVKLLNDEYNPSLKQKDNIVYKCVKGSDLDSLKSVIAVYDEQKDEIAIDQLLMEANGEDMTPLYTAFQSGKILIITYILNQIKTDAQKLMLFNKETSAYHNIYTITKDAKAKEIIKSTVIGILRNAKKTKIKSTEFVSYLHYLVRENDVDSIKQLLNIFKNEKNYIYSLLKSTSSSNFVTPLHIAVKNNFIEMTEYFLGFIKTDQQKQEILFMQDKQGATIMMIACQESNTKITKLLINKLKSNKELLVEFILEENSSAQTCYELEINKKKEECVNLILNSVKNEEITQKILLCSINSQRNVLIDKIVSKLKLSQLQKLLQSFDKTGNNALSLLLQKGNVKYASIFIKSIDFQDDRAVGNLIAFRNYKSQNLMHLACQSTNLDAAKLLISMCQYFQNFKNELLLSRDEEGRSPLATYLNGAAYAEMSSKTDFITWYLSMVRKAKDRLVLIGQLNANNQTLCDLNAVSSKPKLFKLMLGRLDLNGNDENMLLWSNLLRSAIKSNSDNSLEMMQLIIKKYTERSDQIKLLSMQDKASETVFHIANSKLNKLKYLLSFIDDGNAKILLKKDCKSATTAGKTALHYSQLYRIKELTLMMEKFEDVKPVLLMKDDSNKDIFDTAPNNRLMLKHLDETQLCQYFLDSFDRSKQKDLFPYFEDHAAELMPKLLSSRTTSGNDTLFMKIIKRIYYERYMFNWILPYIKKLNDNDRLKYLQARNSSGENTMYVVGTVIKYLPDLQKIFDLYPNQQAIETALLSTSNKGMTPIYIALNGSRYIVAEAMWNKISNIESKLMSTNPLNSFTSYVRPELYSEWSLQALNEMKSDTYIDNVEILIEPFRQAITAKNVTLIKLIISKINPKNKDKILKFVTTKMANKKGENVLHFAAKSQLLEPMQLLFKMIIDNVKDCDIGKDILLNIERSGNENNETPLISAINSDQPQNIRYLLQLIKNKKDKMKLVEMETKFTLAKTLENYKNENDYTTTRNAVFIALKEHRIFCLKQLLSIYDKKSISSVVKYKNSKNQTIYHFIGSLKIAEFLESEYKVSFGFKQFNLSGGVDGDTMFMNAVRNQKPKLMKWMLSKCSKPIEKLQLICDYNSKGENALDKASSAWDASIRSTLVNTVKQVLSSYKQIKDINLIIPIFFYSLKRGKISLSKWLLNLLNTNSEKRKLINSSNKFGVNTIMMSVMNAQRSSLEFILSDKQLLDFDSIFEKDDKGLTAIHYSCCKASNYNTYLTLNRILSFYKDAQKTEFSKLMFLKDNNNNIPFYYMVKNNNATGKLFKWVMKNCFNDIENEKERIYLQLRMIFAQSQNGINLLFMSSHTTFPSGNNLSVTQLIYKYFQLIDSIDNDKDMDLAGYSLLYLGKNNWNVLKLIISKAKDEQQLSEILSKFCKNNECGRDLLFYICQSLTYPHIINWYLNEIIPDNHPMLFTRGNVDGKTALSNSVKLGALNIAEKILSKITDKKQKLKLIQMKDNKNESILDFAKRDNRTSVVNWIQNQIQACN